MPSFEGLKDGQFNGGTSGVSSELTQYSQTQPIANLPKPNSKAAGYQALAEAFGDTAQKSFQQATKMAEEASQANLMQSSNQIEDLKTNAQIQMINDPQHALSVAQVSQYTTDSIKNNAILNKIDRSKLDYMINRSQNAINLKAAEVDHHQQLITISNNLWTESKTSLAQMEDAINRGDMKTAEIIEQTISKNATNAARLGAISSQQLLRLHETVSGLYDRAQSLVNMSQHPDGVTAEQYHSVRASAFSSNSLDKIGQPVDQNTAWMANHLQTDRSMQGQFNALYNGQPYNLGVVAGASDAEYNKFKLSFAGVQQVQGMLAAGTPFNLIQARINAINSQSKPLSPMEEGMVKYWESLNNRLNTDNAMYGILGQTVLGAQYITNHKAKSEMLQSTKSGDDLATSMRENDNELIGNMISLAHASNMDWHLIKPIPSEYINDIKSSFQPNVPLLPALQRLEYLNPEFRAYAADAMPRPHQGVAVWVAGLTMGRSDTSFQADLIRANQDPVAPIGETKGNQDKSSLILSGKEGVGTKPDNIWNDIVNANDDMKALYAYLAKMPNGQRAQAGFRQMAINYIYDQAQRAGDANIDHKDQYINTFTTNVLKGFNLYKTDKAIINLNDIPISRTQDMDYLTNYSLSQAYKHLHEGKTEMEFQRDIDLNPLMIVSIPDRRLVAMDRFGRVALTVDGHEAFDMPYTSNMLYAAQKEANNINAYLLNYGGISSQEKLATPLTESFKNKEGELQLPTSPQEVMLRSEGLKEKAKEAKRNEQAILKAKAEKETKKEPK